ncbi:hypothetical protein [Photobacterium sanguinicancri]|nr:hypothetical protein [Photobacterium sanguinicancri]
MTIFTQFHDAIESNAFNDSTDHASDAEIARQALVKKLQLAGGITLIED